MSSGSEGRLTQWLEIIAAVGVILSLLFVGFEIRQNTAIARGEARQNLAQLNQDWLVLLGQDAEFESLWHRAFFAPEPQPLTEAEDRRAHYIMTVHIRRLENVYLQYRQGLVSESALQNYGFASAESLNTPQFERYWIEFEWRDGFDPEFADFLDKARGAAPD